MVGLERASSIENEPLTLNIEQIQFAREAALCVVNTRSVEEAVRIFTVGLEPVVSSGSGNNGTMVDYGEEGLEPVVSSGSGNNGTMVENGEEGLEPVVSSGSGNNGTMVDYGEEVDYSIHHLTSPRLRDIASAPF
ncbi:unnamed protein product [Ilex paraguariensis]|uniref:Uncharacterized protein n=1 Tax=Ilex paraguariensis TaxID=185542 RepID=A0ABC8RPM1_9AQUA